MKKCFSVLLIIVLVIQEPSLSKAGCFKRDMYRSRQAYMHYVIEKAINLKDVQEEDEFQIKYYLNGGSFPAQNPKSYRLSDLPVALKPPVRAGYNFAGWYTDSAFTKKISAIDETCIQNYSLYAKWTKRIDGRFSVWAYSYPNSNLSVRTVKKLKDCSYDFLKNVKIPGMPSTREDDARKNRIADTSQCPQGICIAKDYLLITSYSGSRDGSLGCIYIFDRENGSYLGALGMKGDSHLGGIAFDGENVWVCHSERRTLECIPYQFIRQIAAIRPRSVVDCSALFEEYHVSNTPSCIAYSDGRLWVATHTKLLNSRMYSYKVTQNGLRQTSSCKIPDKVQGIAFDDDGRVYISASYGRTKSSYLKAYESIDLLNSRPNKPMARVEMPPCSEEIALAGEEIYILFESAGEKYFEGTDGKGTSLSPIDEVLVLSKESIFQ